MKILFLLFTLFVMLPAYAAKKKKASAKSGAAFSLEKLQGAYRKNASLEADFLQEVYQASLGRTKTSKGNLKLSKPNLARWEIYEPEASVMVSDGHKLSYYTPDARGKGKGQVIERKSTELARQPLFRILTGQAPLEQEFKVEKREEIEGTDQAEKWTKLVLKPRKKIGDIVTVQLKVDPKYLIREMITESETGNKTKITLQNQVLGAKLPPALFEFKPPADTEVLQN
jgi:outer membrane lipoprotein carrier protein